VDAGTAARVAEAAHQICPYARVTRANIEVTLEAN
jgi:organic hydroperoxide reductase OsmC/OhrA